MALFIRPSTSNTVDEITNMLILTDCLILHMDQYEHKYRIHNLDKYVSAVKLECFTKLHVLTIYVYDTQWTMTCITDTYRIYQKDGIDVETFGNTLANIFEKEDGGHSLL